MSWIAPVPRRTEPGRPVCHQPDTWVAYLPGQADALGLPALDTSDAPVTVSRRAAEGNTPSCGPLPDHGTR
jgi:hypothetical protein